MAVLEIYEPENKFSDRRTSSLGQRRSGRRGASEERARSELGASAEERAGASEDREETSCLMKHDDA